MTLSVDIVVENSETGMSPLHHMLGAQATVDLQSSVLSFDKRDNIAAEEHFHLSIAILEKLILRDLRSIIEQVGQEIDNGFEESEVVLLLDITRSSICE